MAYIGNSPQQGVRQRFYYTATAGQTTFSGTDINGLTLKYTDSEYVDVYANGILLQKDIDYAATTRTSVVLTSGLQAGDLVEIIVYGIFAVADTVSASRGGVFSGSVNVNSNLVVTGNVGIGTSSPTSNLHVIGTANVTSNLVVGGTTLSVNGNNISPVQSFRNKIINGNFDFWQRQTSNTNVISGQYVADRWINVKFGAPTLNISQQSFTVGQTAVPYESQYFYRANTVSSTGTANGIYVSQRVESVRTLAGQTATLSFYAKADASKNVAVEFVQNFGTNGSAEANGVNVTTFSLTSSWQKFNTTITLPSISGKTVDSANANYLGVNFWLDAGSTYNSRTNSLGQQSGTFDIAQVQLEAGSVATPFEVRPMQTELALCQRYFQIIQLTSWIRGTGGVSGDGNSVVNYFNIPIKMRVTPTLTDDSTAAAYYSAGAVWVTSGSTSFKAVGGNILTIGVTNAAIGSGTNFIWRWNSTGISTAFLNSEL